MVENGETGESIVVLVETTKPTRESTWKIGPQGQPVEIKPFERSSEKNLLVHAENEQFKEENARLRKENKQIKEGWTIAIVMIICACVYGTLVLGLYLFG